MNSSPTTTIPVVLITGFGPFRSVVTNPSWEVAKALKNYLEWTRPIQIVLEQLQVTYDDVTSRVPDYWLKHNPRVSLIPQHQILFFFHPASHSSRRRERYARNQIRDLCMQYGLLLRG